ncbi:MAG TPA: DUF503 domain-containing protein [Longimicrobiales bacterium]|nr:DUF503 domain-containing protein [Longimicrobiales bacterium]
MVVGVIRWEIQVYDAGSLKEKRKVVKGLKDRLRSRFNVSVAETAHQDLWQRAELTACVVATDRRRAESILDRADELVEREALGRIIETDRIFY